jgi:spermidine synthase
VLVFTATLFGSAFLLFLVEPMIAKMVLPLLGGSPSVWNTCVVFFQAMLLAGYAWAHGTTGRLGARRQSVLQVALAIAPLAVLPFSIRQLSGPPADGSPVVWLLAVLLLSVGLPFFVLSTSAAVLQKWFSTTDHPAANDPYFLYAASNVGSLLALLAYPVLIEPRFTLQQQARVWSAGYAVYLVFAIACATIVWRQRANGVDAQANAPRGAADARVLSCDAASITWSTRLRWLALACVPSSLMLGVTTYLSTDIAAIPLLWVVPLALYLLTFVVAFSSWSVRAMKVSDRLLPLALLPMAMTMLGRAGAPLPLAIVLHLGGFVGIGLVCHGLLAASRPSTRHLTEFYLWIAVGGMVGGLFNSLLAPVVFTSIVEYPIAVVAACLLRVRFTEQKLWIDRRALAIGIPVAVAVVSLAAVLWANATLPTARMFMVSLSVPAILAFTVARRPMSFAISIGLIFLAGLLFNPGFGAVEHAERTFFGVYRVHVDHQGGYRYLLHGTTLHGLQRTDPARRGETLSYYHPTGPVGDVFAALPAAARYRVGVIGLGAGVIAGYAKPNQYWTFFEIDPAVERIARDPRFFTYLSTCGSRCDVALGDARLSLLRARDGEFDLIVLDAFSSDAIPMHLLTAEALALYRQKLAPGGALLFHVSNRHLVLAPVVGRLAAAAGLTVVHRHDPNGDPSIAKIASNWMVLTRSASDLGALAARKDWVAPQVFASTPLWTDDFTNIFSVLRRPSAAP